MALLIASFVSLLATKVQSRTYQPVDVGFQFSTPVELANTLQNSVAGPLSVVVVVAFTAILVAGLFLPKMSWSSRSSSDDESWWQKMLDPLNADEAFELMNDLADPCRRKILCHVHSFVPFAPDWLQSIFRFISRNVRGVERYKEDIIYGLGGGDCEKLYREKCRPSIGQLLVTTKPVRRILEQQRRHFQSTSDRYFNF